MKTVILAIVMIVATTALSLGLVTAVLCRLPTDYFVIDRHLSWFRRPWSWRRIALGVLRNLIGVVIVILGLIMSIPGVPGQGFLTILAGLLLLDFPGRYRLMRRILQGRRIGAAVNALRRKFGKEEFILPTKPDA